MSADPPAPEAAKLAYPIIDTGQDACYDASRQIAWPRPGQPWFGQDAQYQGNAPAYRDNRDGTVSDLVTGLTWSKAVDKRKVDLVEAEAIARKMSLGGHRDWRVPTIKELYSLMDFRGATGFNGRDMSAVPANAVPYIDTDYFDFAFGQVAAGERYIDGQWLSSTKYVSTTMDGAETLFGVNFVDGRIKGYGYKHGNRIRKRFYARYVRGPAYGQNKFVDNRDGTVTDQATGLTWTQADSGRGMEWKEALAYAEGLALGGHDDWRLPNAKELQSIVDYTRSPDTTASPAIDPVFKTTAIRNEAGQKDYPFFWTSTTHLDGPMPGAHAAYVAFGRALGEMRGRVMDVHGAGAQRSDPKTGAGGLGHGPQGDARRVKNYVRCVRGGAARLLDRAPAADRSKYPFNVQETVAELREAARGGGSGNQPEGDSPSAGRRFVQRLDRNGDGKVSRQEFDGPPDRFDIEDRNHDGYLTEDEAPRGPPTRRPR